MASALEKQRFQESGRHVTALDAVLVRMHEPERLTWCIAFESEAKPAGLLDH
jgi:hypothetical protein